MSVIVATFKRPEQLAKCLEGFRAQVRPADEVVVIVRHSDDSSARVVAEFADAWSALRVVRVATAGTVAAYNLGLAVATGDFVSYIDDDAIPAPDWLERIHATFEQDERIAGVGGRDIVFENGSVLDVRRRFRWLFGEPSVGRIQWVGRMTANHHVGSGHPRDVDVLKGVNMSFRRDAIAPVGFDPRLLGDGATVHSELSVCLPLRRRGLRIIYDPDITVMHHPAPRLAGQQRDALAPQAVATMAHNEALGILDYVGPVRRVVFALYAFAIGNTESPGIAVACRDLIRGRPAPWARFVAAQRGRATAWRTRRVRRPSPTRGSYELIASQ